jgi:hypothetical protein
LDASFGFAIAASDHNSDRKQYGGNGPTSRGGHAKEEEKEVGTRETPRRRTIPNGMFSIFKKTSVPY